MNNPYKVLGVPENAADDDIKKAYRKLSRKYHPDANINNPDKAAAEERFKEVQQAYQEIMAQRSGKYSTGYGGGYSTGYGGGYSSGYGGAYSSGQRTGGAAETQDEKYFRAAYDYIRAGYYSQALNALQQINNRTAAWYYLSAVANLGVGNNLIAADHAQTAVRMEPDNIEYRQFYSRLQNGAQWYAQRSSPYGGMEPDGDICFKCCAANMLCNCCCRPGFGMGCI